MSINGLINTRIAQKSYKPSNCNSNNVTYSSITRLSTNAALIDFIKDNKIKYTITSKYCDKLNISIDEYDSHIHAIEIYPYY